MTNAFVAALLKTSAEERLKAESLRNQKLQHAAGFAFMVRSMNAGLEKEALEHEGRAEVYEKFAHRLISDVAGDLIVAEFKTLTGPVELLGVDKPFEFVYEYEGWQRNYWKFPIVVPPHPLIVNFLTN